MIVPADEASLMRVHLANEQGVLMSSTEIDGLHDAALSAARLIRDGVKPTAQAYEARRQTLSTLMQRTDFHAEIRKRYGAQLLLVDVTGEQWQELVLQLEARISTLVGLEATTFDTSSESLKATTAKVNSLCERIVRGERDLEVQADLLAVVARTHVDVVSVNTWLGPWTKALITSQALNVQDRYREVLHTTDSRVAKAAAVSAAKTAAALVPIVGPLITGTIDAYEVANTRNRDLQTTSDELTHLDEYLDALSRMAIVFEALLVEPKRAGDVITFPTASEVSDRVLKRQRRLTGTPSRDA